MVTVGLEVGSVIDADENRAIAGSGGRCGVAILHRLQHGLVGRNVGHATDRQHAVGVAGGQRGAGRGGRQQFAAAVRRALKGHGDFRQRGAVGGSDRGAGNDCHRGPAGGIGDGTAGARCHGGRGVGAGRGHDPEIVIGAGLAGGERDLDLVVADSAARRAGSQRAQGQVRGRQKLDAVRAGGQSGKAVRPVGGGLHRSHAGDRAEGSRAADTLQFHGQACEACVAGLLDARVLGVEIGVSGEAARARRSSVRWLPKPGC